MYFLEFSVPCGILDYPKKFILRLALIVVGSIFLNDCQAQPKLPIFFIVTGKYNHISLMHYYCHTCSSSPNLWLYSLSLTVGVVGSTTQIIQQITGYLLKDYHTTRKNVKDLIIVLIFLFGWFPQGNIQMIWKHFKY